MRSALRTAVAALVYLAAALWSYAPVLHDPFATLPVNAGLKTAYDQIGRWDQSVAVASITRNAHTLLSDPSSFFDGYQCFPLPRSYTLGEHMFGSGVLAAIPYALTRDPIFSYNALLVLSAWIAALGMYLLARELVRSEPAAFVSGLLFGLSVYRIAGVLHPFAYADMWTPLAMLHLIRLFATGRLRNALAFALFGSLTVLQSFYPLLWSAVLLACLAMQLALAHRRVLVSRLPAMATSLAVLVTVALLVFLPYLETRYTWNLLGGRMSLPASLDGWLSWSPVLVLGVLGLLDRLRGPRPVLGVDPRASLAIAAVLLLWLAIGGVTVFGVRLSLRAFLHAVIPGMDAVRGLSTMACGTELALAVLAAYGVRAVLERLPAAAAAVVTIGLAVWILIAQQVPLVAWAAAPPEEDLALLRRTTGPVLELPHPAKSSLGALAVADLLRFTSYDVRRSSACYASFGSPLDEPMRALSERVPNKGAIDAMRALGFRTLLLVRGRYFPAVRARIEKDLDALGDRLRLVGINERLALYDLRPGAVASSDTASLVPDERGASEALDAAAGATVVLEIPVANGGTRTFRLPDPIAPSEVVVRWTDAAAEVVREHRVRALLPLALAPATSLPVVVQDTAPDASGDYTVTIGTADAPDRVLGRRTVRVTPPAS